MDIGNTVALGGQSGGSQWGKGGDICNTFINKDKINKNKQRRFLTFRWFIKTTLFKSRQSMLPFDYNSLELCLLLPLTSNLSSAPCCGAQIWQYGLSLKSICDCLHGLPGLTWPDLFPLLPPSPDAHPPIYSPMGFSPWNLWMGICELDGGKSASLFLLTANWNLAFSAIMNVGDKPQSYSQDLWFH